MIALPRGRLYYGWWIALALAVTETISWGVLYYAFSVFITPMEAEFGWSRPETTTALSLALLVAGGMAVPVGFWLDKYGGRALMTTGSILAVFLVVAWANVDDLLTFYLVWIGIGVTMSIVLYEPAFVVVAKWFETRRAAALMIITFAAGFASTIFLPLTNTLLDQLGWRDAVLVLAMILGVGTIPLHALILRRQPQDMGLEPDGISSQIRGTQLQRSVPAAEALRSRLFWWLSAGFSLATLAAMAIRIHFIPFLLEAGYSASFAAAATGLIGAMQVMGRVLFGPLNSRIPTHHTAAVLLFLQVVAMGILIIADSSGMIMLFVVVMGATNGATTLARPTLLAEKFGPAEYGRISSVMAIFVTLALTIGPVGAGIIYDWWDGYDALLWIALAISGFSVAAVLLARDQSVTEREV